MLLITIYALYCITVIHCYPRCILHSQADIGESSKGQTREGANNPVTDGDMLSHKQMYYTMKKAFPDVNVISEEHDTVGEDVVFRN